MTSTFFCMNQQKVIFRICSDVSLPLQNVSFFAIVFQELTLHFATHIYNPTSVPIISTAMSHIPYQIILNYYIVTQRWKGVTCILVRYWFFRQQLSWKRSVTNFSSTLVRLLAYTKSSGTRMDWAFPEMLV